MAFMFEGVGAFSKDPSTPGFEVLFFCDYRIMAGMDSGMAIIQGNGVVEQGGRSAGLGRPLAPARETRRSNKMPLEDLSTALASLQPHNRPWDQHVANKS
jgi:hypothetical protein